MSSLVVSVIPWTSSIIGFSDGLTRLSATPMQTISQQFQVDLNQRGEGYPVDSVLVRTCENDEGYRIPPVLT